MGAKKILYEARRKIEKARRLSEEAEQAERDVFNFLDKIGVEFRMETKAENADNLGDAVSCYIQYGEFGIESLMEEIRDSSEFLKELEGKE